MCAVCMCAVRMWAVCTCVVCMCMVRMCAVSMCAVRICAVIMCAVCVLCVVALFLPTCADFGKNGTTLTMYTLLHYCTIKDVVFPYSHMTQINTFLQYNRFVLTQHIWHLNISESDIS